MVRGSAGGSSPPVTSLYWKLFPVRILCEPHCQVNMYRDSIPAWRFSSFFLSFILHYLSLMINSHLLCSICIIYLIYNLNFGIVIPSSKSTKLNGYKTRLYECEFTFSTKCSIKWTAPSEGPFSNVLKKTVYRLSGLLLKLCRLIYAVPKSAPKTELFIYMCIQNQQGASIKFLTSQKFEATIIFENSNRLG